MAEHDIILLQKNAAGKFEERVLASAEPGVEGAIRGAVGLEAGQSAMPSDTPIPDSAAILSTVGLQPGQSAASTDDTQILPQFTSAYYTNAMS